MNSRLKKPVQIVFNLLLVVAITYVLSFPITGAVAQKFATDVTTVISTEKTVVTEKEKLSTLWYASVEKDKAYLVFIRPYTNVVYTMSAINFMSKFK